MLKPVLDTDDTLRTMIAKCSIGLEGGLESFRAVVREVECRVQVCKMYVFSAVADIWNRPRSRLRV